MFRKGCQQKNNTGIQTRAMAQRVDNKANLEQLQRAVGPSYESHSRTTQDQGKMPSRNSYDNTAPSTLIGMYQISATLE